MPLLHQLRPLAVPFAGIEVAMDRETLHVRSLEPRAVVSSAVVGAGEDLIQDFFVLRVPRDYAGSNPANDLRRAADVLGLTGPFVGFMTAAPVDAPRIAVAERDGIRVLIIATVGLGNLCAAGLSPPAPRPAGTINLLILVNAPLTRGALVNAVITATEAKALALSARGLRTAEGWPASGTSTDAIAVASESKGSPLPYAGPVTPVGWLIGRCVHRVLWDLPEHERDHYRPAARGLA